MIKKSQDPSKLQIGGNHYLNMEVQPWEFIIKFLEPEQAEGYFIGTAIAYIMRHGLKEGTDDLAKAAHTMDYFLTSKGITPQNADQWGVPKEYQNIPNLQKYIEEGIEAMKASKPKKRTK